MVKFYLAPMEGLTGYIFRQTYHKYFHNVDRYFTPFLTSRKLSWKEKNEILPENNQGIDVIPQILTNRIEDFLDIVKQVEALGYSEVNLNLGCPSGTVVAKKRGAGMLAEPEALDRFLDGIYTKSPLPISIKTRIGIEEEEEWEELLNIYHQYPFTELIIHPRLQKDFYKNPIHLDLFEQTVKKGKGSLCYNGEIHSPRDYDVFVQRFPEIEKVMFGRGIFKNPGLIGEIRGEGTLKLEVLEGFHGELLEKYAQIMSGDVHTLYRMKEIWVYLGEYFPKAAKGLKKIRKSGTISQYRLAVEEVFRTKEE